MRSDVRLTQSATIALPRKILLAICICYAVTGLFGRDIWKNEDAEGFGAMISLAQGSTFDWIFPNIYGRIITSSGPFIYWAGALSIRFFHHIVGDMNAARIPIVIFFLTTCALIWYSSYLLGKHPEVQPFQFIFGGQPTPKDYGRTLADGALLIFLASFGLAERGHETTPEIAQLFCISLVLLGLVKSIDQPIKGACIWGLSIGLLLLSAKPILVLFLLLSIFFFASQQTDLKKSLSKLICLGLPIAASVSLIWPLLAFYLAPNYSQTYFIHWLQTDFENYPRFSITSAQSNLKNLLLFSWPAWPLAIWSIWYWKKWRQSLHLVIPIMILLPIIILVFSKSHASNLLFVLLLPGLAIQATFALPTLKRGAISAIDWFAILSFTVLSIFVWLIWLASLTGFPTSLANNLRRFLPGLHHEFSYSTFVIAITATTSWVGIVYWRITTFPKVLWRSVVLSSAGTTLMWVLLMTLWLPLVDYGRSYRQVAQQLSQHLSKNYDCVETLNLGEAQLASFGYFANIRFAQNDKTCHFLLVQSKRQQHNYELPQIIHNQFNLMWEGRRAADKDELFRLYARVEK